MAFVQVEPNLRWMQFVDGENLAIRAKHIAKERGRILSQSPRYMEDCFVWYPNRANHILTMFKGNSPYLHGTALRAFYYTSVKGAESERTAVRGALKELGFHPQVFEKKVRRGRADENGTQVLRSKQVDIQLATDLLSNAFRGNFDAAVLVAGDGDYVPLVEEVKRLGKLVFVYFFESVTSPELKLCADGFSDITDEFIKCATAPMPRV